MGALTSASFAHCLPQSHIRPLRRAATLRPFCYSFAVHFRNRVHTNRSRVVTPTSLAMLSRRLATAARMVPLRQMRPRAQLVMLPAMMQTVRSYADRVVQVPQMAESISEGTLKQFSKGVGDYVEQDEEIATIETDKVRLLPRPAAVC